ncbi:MAG: type II restriction endonuclease [Treponema sp.]|nr:type II restriction endonuclease [Treponema sp.]
MDRFTYIKKPEDLVTSYTETRAGFIAIALEKNRRATPFIEEAGVLQHRIKKIITPEKLLEVPNIRSGLVAASGISDKAASHLGDDGCLASIKEFIEKFLVPAGSKFKEELIFRFLLTKGDTLGGKMRNIVGALAQRKLCVAIISALRMSKKNFSVLINNTNQWISSKEITEDTEIESSRGISWKTSKNKNRTLYFNITVPVVKNNIDMILLNRAHTDEIKTIIGNCEHYVALGELKGGIDPAGADEHWKTAKTAIDRIKVAFKKKGYTPYIFFIGAAIEYKMATELFENLKSKYINNVANLTKPEHIIALSDWLIDI